MSAAASKGTAAAAWDSSADRDISDLIEQRMPDGISIWSLGTVACIIESLVEDAPAVFVELIRQRVWANLTGRCPRCDAVTDIRAEGRGVLHHANHCEVAHPPVDLARYIAPAATAALAAARASTSTHRSERDPA